jgi:hypothetical protein
LNPSNAEGVAKRLFSPDFQIPEILSNYPHPRGGRKAWEEISLGYLSALLDFRIFPSSSQSWN